MIRIAQIGCGYWGPNLLRNFRSLNNCSVEEVIEPNIDRQRFIKDSFPNVNVGSDVSGVLNKKTIDAVIIATPADEHFKLAKKALLADKHVFVEKPMARSVEEVQELTEISNSRKLTLMSGHTFLYNDAVKFIKSQIDSEETGDLRYIYSQRLNLGRIRSDVDALWNFAPHDVSIIQYLLNDPTPIEINSQGMDFIQSGINDVSFLNIKYDSCIANIHVSWLDPLKTRKVVIVGSKKMIVYDDVAEDKIIIYDKGIDKFSKLGENMDFDSPSDLTFKYRYGDIWIPKIDYREPLKTEANHFLECIKSGKEPISGTTHTLQVIKILEEASSK